MVVAVGAPGSLLGRAPCKGKGSCFSIRYATVVFRVIRAKKGGAEVSAMGHANVDMWAANLGDLDIACWIRSG